MRPGALVVAALGAAYWLGIRRLRRAGVAWPTGRPWWFALGLAPDLWMDQIIGAGVLWIGGDLAGLPFLAAVVPG